jgi:phosphoribosylanthranilate isomerase
MVKVKICGLSLLCDIEAVNEAMPDYIGFVFAESRRKITPRQAFTLREKLCPEIMAVGVFVDAPIENIIELVTKGAIDMIQLHGAEDEAYIQKIKALIDNPIIKAVSVNGKGDVQKWNDTSADYLLLDHQSGGTGETFDWDMIGDVSKPYFLAGGLNPENINTAIKTAAPFAVDTSSGVETDGYKDPSKITEFMRLVRYGN